MIADNGNGSLVDGPIGSLLLLGVMIRTTGQVLELIGFVISDTGDLEGLRKEGMVLKLMDELVVGFSIEARESARFHNAERSGPLIVGAAADDFGDGLHAGLAFTASFSKENGSHDFLSVRGG